MKFSTRGRYGIRALLDIALNGKKGPVLLREIAERQEFSLWYLQHLLNPLIASGIVRSTRGPGGGVSLTKPPAQIKLIEVIDLLEGSVAPVECVNDPSVCSRSQTCVTRDTWVEIKQSINQILQDTTLQDLVERHRKKQQSGENIYHI
jgi:Rrf2 family transcriptional regulator, cysteine metabolism repressor